MLHFVPFYSGLVWTCTIRFILVLRPYCSTSTVQYPLLPFWCGFLQCGVVRSGMVRFGPVWSGQVWSGLVRSTPVVFVVPSIPVKYAPVCLGLVCHGRVVTGNVQSRLMCFSLAVLLLPLCTLYCPVNGHAPLSTVNKIRNFLAYFILVLDFCRWDTGIARTNLFNNT